MRFAKLKHTVALVVTARRRQFFKNMCVSSAVLLISACGGGSGDGAAFDPDSSTSCEVGYQNQWVYNNMRDYYLFYDQVPVVNPQSYESPELLLKDIRFEERDPFSFLTDAGASNLQFEQGREFGLGYLWGYDGEGNARILQVVEDSPFARAGIERGDIVISVDGLSWRSDALLAVFEQDVVGTAEAPGQANWLLERRASGERVELVITAAEYSINTVEAVAEYTNDDTGEKTGYFVFNRFLETSEQELRDTFERFSQSGISDLIVDLRYNRGGRVYVAEILASLIAGNARADNLLYRYQYNDKYQEENYELYLQESAVDLNLARVVFITRSGTASSSEIVTLGLSPHMEVVTVGSGTAGKPYIQRGRDRCGMKLNAIEAEGFNAADVSVFGGMPASCLAPDDRSHDFGRSDGALEGMLQASLDYLADGRCATSIAAKSVGSRERDAVEQSVLQGFKVHQGAF